MKKLFILFSTVIVFISCTNEEETHNAMEENPGHEKLVAVIHAINGSEVSGTVYFEKVEEGVQVTAEVTGLTGEKHGFHIKMGIAQQMMVPPPEDISILMDWKMQLLIY